MNAAFGDEPSIYLSNYQTGLIIPVVRLGKNYNPYDWIHIANLHPRKCGPLLQQITNVRAYLEDGTELPTDFFVTAIYELRDCPYIGAIRFNQRYFNILRTHRIVLVAELTRNITDPASKVDYISLRLNWNSPIELGGVRSTMRSLRNRVDYDLQLAQTNTDLPLNPNQNNHLIAPLNNPNNNENNVPFQQVQVNSETVVETDEAEILEVFTRSNYVVADKTLEKGLYYLIRTGSKQAGSYNQLPETEPGVEESQSIANLIRNSERLELNTQHRYTDDPRQNYDLITLDHNFIVVMHNQNTRTPAEIRNNFAFVRQWNDQGRSFRVYTNQVQLNNNSNLLVDVTRTVFNAFGRYFSTLMNDNDGNAYCIGDASSQCNTGFAQRVNLPNNNNNVAPFVEDEYVGRDNTYYFLERNNAIQAMSTNGKVSNITVENLMPGEVLVGFAHSNIYNGEIYLQSSLKRYFSISYSSLAGSSSEAVAIPLTPVNTRKLVSDTNATYYDYLDQHDHEYYYKVFGYANKDGIPDTPDGYISPDKAHYLFKSTI
jgi:hypothetical protein